MAIRVHRRKRRQVSTTGIEAVGGIVALLDAVNVNVPIVFKTSVDLSLSVADLIVDTSNLAEVGRCRLYEEATGFWGVCEDVFVQATGPSGAVVSLVFNLLVVAPFTVRLYIPQRWSVIAAPTGGYISAVRDPQIDAQAPAEAQKGLIILRNP